MENSDKKKIESDVTRDLPATIVESNSPLRLPVLPLRNAVLFPTMAMPISVGRPKSIKALDYATDHGREVLVVAQKNHDVDDPTGADVYTIGTRAVIKKILRFDTPEPRVDVILHGTERVLIQRVYIPTAENPLDAANGALDSGALFAEVKALPQPLGIEAEPGELQALQRSIMQIAERIESSAQGQRPISIVQILSQLGDPLLQAFMIASLFNFELDREQIILEKPTAIEAMRYVHALMTKELQIHEVRVKIAQRAENEMGKEKKDYLLRQQLKAIQDELGDKDTADLDNFREKIKDLPEDIRPVVEKELNRLLRTPQQSPEYQLIRSYLELVTELPWTFDPAKDLSKIDLAKTRQVLDDDHYGLNDVKKRIREFLAVRKLNPDSSRAPILCLVGPPGVGKTSLGESVARALDRKFGRISLGGLHDESELRGHRRTYIGAMPGRIIQTLQRLKTKAPVLLLDEIDKLGRDFRGDPAYALLEILDPAQNHTFRDNYLDLPYDLSKVFFIATANTLDGIPPPLLDRMEIIRIAGYTEDEKLRIAEQYLLPRQIKDAGLQNEPIEVKSEATREVIRWFTRESGVRQLDKALATLCRRMALEIVDEPKKPNGKRAKKKISITKENIVDLLGKERFIVETKREKLQTGVAAGLAWTESGGDVLYVESIALPYAPQNGSLKLTGQLGSVMRESAEAAYSFVWAHAEKFGIKLQKMKQKSIHVHVPQGAIPKDGPSAGITMAMSLVSLATDTDLRSDTAMTGEITLSGLVLPIGGVKEKILGARRLGIKRILLPKGNEKDLVTIDEAVLKDSEFVFVDNIFDAWKAASTPKAKQKKISVAQKLVNDALSNTRRKHKHKQKGSVP